MKRFYYLFSLLAVFFIPALIESFFVGSRISWQSLLPFVIGISITGAFWDHWATQHGKKDIVWLWVFNKKNTLGIRLFDLPIEEYLFYIVTSLYIVFTWESIQLVSVTGDPHISGMLLFLALWTFSAIGLPYLIRNKHDRV